LKKVWEFVTLLSHLIGSEPEVMAEHQGSLNYTLTVHQNSRKQLY